MPWVSVQSDIIDHPKTRKLAQLLGVRRHEAIGLLVSLWLWGLKNADESGIILSATARDIADGIMWRGCPAKNDAHTDADADAHNVVACLIKSGWVDNAGDGLRLHDWDEWQKDWYKLQRRKKLGAARQKAYIQRKSSEENDAVADAHTDAKSDAHNRNLNHKEKIYKKEVTSTRFKPPTVDEARAYCEERRNGIDAAVFVDSYTAKGWLVGKTPMKDWRAAVRTWEKKDRAA